GQDGQGAGRRDGPGQRRQARGGADGAQREGWLTEDQGPVRPAADRQAGGRPDHHRPVRVYGAEGQGPDPDRTQRRRDAGRGQDENRLRIRDRQGTGGLITPDARFNARTRYDREAVPADSTASGSGKWMRATFSRSSRVCSSSGQPKRSLI